ncbi:P-loop NTPase [Calditerrivibrio nitroreducens]|uniref:Flagellar biosynthesis protein FlhG n=1 Tax=Calditerrivibrio nitroreducens (strain DSM 19672 / NBRC 101217 / Yu37-1) TaxID=768670 RepID=E4TFG5_CALNY|nr:P-loop NTPase [Calditerrivibrio nitroreducens]ADR19538.1 flagellar biosynthesis protein FlhG [Calditerrivibrio nitroreducens DSM 19672]
MAEIIAVASGKGGVGKSFFSANLAMSMKKLYDAILLVDGDLGGANLHSFVGLKAQGKGIYNFLKENFRIEDVILETPAQVDFIGGSSDILGMAHINNFEKLKILNHLKRANYKYVVMDLGAGTSYNMIDFFNFSDKKVLIMNSEPTSIENSYGFLKIALYRKIERHLFKDPRLENICSKLRSRSMNYQRVDDILEELDRIDRKISEEVLEIVSEYKVGLVLNMLKFKKELNIFYGFENVSKKYLRISVEKLGFLPYDLYVSESLKKLEPYYLNTTDSNREFFDDIRDLILKKL